MRSTMVQGWAGRTARLIVVALPASCGGPINVETTVADSAGVAIVTNVGEPTVLRWTLDTVRIFGGEESGPATFHLAQPSLVDVDSQGRIYVLEPFEYRVTVFDSTGAPLGSMGRQGEGPGELEWAMSVSVRDDGRAYVHDGAGQIVELRMGDQAGTESAFNYAVILASLRHVEATSRGFLIWARRRINPTGPNVGHDDWVERLLSVTGRDTVELISGKSSHSTTASYPRCSFTFSIRRPLAPQNRWSHWGDRVALTAWGGFRIDILDDHRLDTSVRWAGVGDRELTRLKAKALLEARGYLGPCDDDLDETLEKHGFHPRPQLVGELAVAPDGYVWAQLLTRDNAFRVLLLDPEGRIAGVLPDGFPMPLTFLPDGHPLVSVVDSLDIERIGVGRVVR
ncbi:MAG: hypothetical protein OXI83_03600 [Gemmatimonadota bacterium]|nr:hypothetical protein [Gemmatimonadota bacterium]